MSNEFNDLIDDFLNHKPDNSKKPEDPTANSMIKMVLESIANFKMLEDNEEDLEKSISERLGEPSEVEDYIKDGLRFQKLIWNTPQGQFVKIIVNEASELTLQEQLEKAVDEEDYDLAIELRDQIKASEK